MHPEKPASFLIFTEGDEFITEDLAEDPSLRLLVNRIDSMESSMRESIVSITA